MYEVLREKPEKFISINGFLTCRLSTHNWLNCTIHNWELDFNAVVLVNRGRLGCNLQNFSVTLILCEIKFGESRDAKTAN